MWFEVVDVGDGACTVLKHYGESMVMDCGSWRDRDGKGSARRLTAALGASAHIPSTVVVTHFDLDHWMGLKAFADAAPSGSRCIRLVYPRFPSRLKRVQASLLAYQTLRLTAPERSAVDLFHALESKSAKVFRTAAYAGDTFFAVGTSWTVRWPPPALGARVSKTFERVAKESEDLAKEYEPLGRALEWANESRFFTEDEERWNNLPNESTLITDTDEPPLLIEDDLLRRYRNDDFADASDELRKRLRNNRREVQGINNELSLVVEETHGRLLNLGDIQRWGLNALIQSRTLRKCYDTILAPHHGTQAPGSLSLPHFPWSQRVIAQNGKSHYRRLRIELGDHTHNLISTAAKGSIPIIGRYHNPPTHCECRSP